MKLNRQNEKSTKKFGEPGTQIGKFADGVTVAAIEVQRALGRGFRESGYEEALCAELDRRGIE